MPPPATSERYKNHRFPGEIISHGVWLSYRFTLSYRDVEELLFERGVTVSQLPTGTFATTICRSQIYHLFFRQIQKQNLPSAFWKRGTHRGL